MTSLDIWDMYFVNVDDISRYSVQIDFGGALAGTKKTFMQALCDVVDIPVVFEKMMPLEMIDMQLDLSILVDIFLEVKIE